MRICFASTLYPGLHNRWGGAEVACQRLHNLLKKESHRVAVVTTRPDPRVRGGGRLPAEGGAYGDQGSVDGLEHYSVPTVADYLGRTAAMALDTLIPFDALAYRPMLRLLDTVRPEVVHLHSFKELTFSVLSAAKRRKLPVFFSLYDLWALCPQSNLAHYRGGTCPPTTYAGRGRSHMGFGCLACAVPARKPLVLFRRIFFEHFLPQIDGFIVLSDTVKRQLAEFGLPRRKISVLPLPLFEQFVPRSPKAPPTAGHPPPPGNPWASKPGAGLDDRSILFAGWMIRPKGLHILIEAMPSVLARVPEAKVLVVETGAHAEHKAGFQRRIAELGLTHKFHFLGKKNAKEIQALLARASVVAVPEQWGIAWPIFCTEAMSYGKPIAASRIGDIPRFIRDGETGRLFDPQSPEQLADCLVSFFDDPAAALRMGRRAQDFILDACDPGRITATLLKLYEEVL